MTDIRERWAHAQQIEPGLHLNESFEEGRRGYEKAYQQYFRYTGGSFDLKGRSVLEIGPAHFPALSYCSNFGAGYVLDPMDSEFLRLSIAEKNIEHIPYPAEDIEFPRVDEIWLFNVLTHVIDPVEIIEKCKRAARIVRFFEPINQGIDECHLHDFNLDFFSIHFGKCTTHYPTNNRAVNFHQHEAAYGAFENDYPEEAPPPPPTIISNTPAGTFNFKKVQKVCISLKSSGERREFVRTEFSRIGASVSFLPAVDKRTVKIPELCKKTPGVYACMQSHLEAIKWAKKGGLDAICVFEDDVVFCDDFSDRIRYIESLRGFDFDILALGGHFESKHHAGHPTPWKHIQRLTQMGGTYAYIFKASVFDFIIDNATYNYGADEFYSNHVYHRFRSFAFVPFLCGCRPGKSTITDQVWEYENIKWTYEQKAIEI